MLEVAAVVAIVVSGIHVIEGAVYLLMGSGGFRALDLSWRFYVEPVLRSTIVFLVVLVVSALLLRTVHRRQRPVSDDT